MMTLIQRPPAWVRIAALVLLGLAAFWPTLGFDFVNWDDPAYVLDNTLIDAWSPTNLKGIATEVVSRNFAPITIFSFLVDHTLWGRNAGGYHLTNLLLHLVNGVLVLVLARRLTGSPFVGWLTAALFTIHPVQIETVAWISSRKGLLCSVFMLGAALARLKPEPGARDDFRYFGLLALALLAKAHAVVLPPIVLLYDVVVRRQKVATALRAQFIPVLMALGMLLLTIGAQGSGMGGVRQHMSLGLPRILAVDVTILWRYVGMLLLPTDLSVMYDPPTSGIWKQVVIGGIGWAAVAFGLWGARRSRPLWIFGALTFLLLLVPVLNLTPITTLMNDRYLYLPCIVVFAMVAGVIEHAAWMAGRNAGGFQRIAARGIRAGASAVALVGCFALTAAHLPVWKDSNSLWSDTLKKYPDMPIARIQMAQAVHDGGDIREAIRLLYLALAQSRPDDRDRERMLQLIVEWTNELSRR